MRQAEHSSKPEDDEDVRGFFGPRSSDQAPMMSKVQKATCAIHPATVAEPIGVSVYAEVWPAAVRARGLALPLL